MIKLKYPRRRNFTTAFILRFSLLLLVTTSLIHCDERKSQSTLPESTGQAGELVIVVDTLSWKSELGDSLRSCFSGIQPGLPEREPVFDVIHIVPRAFTSIFKTTTNILVIEIEGDGKAGYLESRDVWASGQLYVKLVARDYAQGARIIGKNKQQLRQLFLESAFRKIQKNTLKAPSSEVMDISKAKIGAAFKLPKGFVKVRDADEVVYWRRDQRIGEHNVIQGVIGYRFGYQKESNLFLSELMNRRDEVTKQMVLGNSVENHMEIFRLYEPDTASIQIQGNYTKEMRGLWKMKNEFMGGPFFSYYVVDEKAGEIFVFDGFVYAPKFPKRKYIRELEAMARMMQFN